MKTFIESVANDLLIKKINFSATTLIFPSKRPILFFTNTLKRMNCYGILPNFITIEDWIQKITGHTDLSGISLWMSFYRVYITSVNEPQSFEEFIKWAPTILNDFNDLDKSLADTNAFFYGMVSAERIEKWGKADWQTNTQLIEDHLFFWKEMKVAYQNLVQYFRKEKKGYAGFLYKEVLELLPSYLQKTNENYVFIGFNALTPVEEKIITHCLDNNRAKIYWETDKYYLNNPDQEAGDFFRKYKKWKQYENQEFSFVFDHFKQKKEINSYAVPAQINQAKLIGQLIEKIPNEELQNSAIVLADENLLTPLLNSLPENISAINITMGLAVKTIPLSFFFDYLILLHMNRIERNYNQNKFYYADVFNLLNASFLPKNPEIESFIKYLKKNNHSFITPNLVQTHLKNTPYFSLFEPFSTIKSFLEAVTKWLDKTIQAEKEKMSQLNLESIIQFHQIFIKLLNEISAYQLEITFKSLHFLYNSLKNLEKISFIGEPLTGLQIVGMLETRLLNFDRIIVANMNEGVVSQGNQPNSLITNDVRKSFGLITNHEKESIFAYHFYRLMQNAKNIDLIYTTSSKDLGVQEKSRFITQLEIESPHKINVIQATPNVKINEEEKIEIEKTPFVLEKINEYFAKGISASGLNNYVQNPMDFYFDTVLCIQQLVELEAEISSATIGNIVHESLKTLYEPYLNKIIIKEDLHEIEKKITETVNQSFRKKYKEGEYEFGKNHLAYQMILKMVSRFISLDKDLVNQNNELIIRELEKNLETDFQLENKVVVRLKGSLDRVDELNGKLRIVDYKTGKTKIEDITLNQEKLIKLIDKTNYRYAVQLIMYLYLYYNHNPKTQSISAGIYSATNTKEGFMPLSYNGKEEINKETLADLMKPIEEIILEILDPEIFIVDKERIYYF
jgi:ATP-dependent helicase/nuclease subunit B